MPRRKRIVPGKTEQTVKEDTKEIKEAKEAKAAPVKEEYSTESLVDLVCAYTSYTRGQARNLITGVLSPAANTLIGDVIEWCVHLKDLEKQQAIVNLVASGDALVERQNGRWLLVDRLDRGNREN